MLAGTHFDPRPDIKHDHHLWRRILICCQGQPDMQGRLHYIRCLGGQVIETPAMYRIMQGGMADGEWADAKARLLAPVQGRLAELFPVWRRKWLAEDVLDFAADAGMTLEEAEETLLNCPFRKPEQEELWR